MRAQRPILEVAEDVMPVVDRPGIVQREVEEGLEAVLLPAEGDGRHDLVEVEVAKRLGLRRLVDRVAHVG